MAYLAVTLNLFGDALYQKRGGKGQVKDNPQTFVGNVDTHLQTSCSCWHWVRWYI